MDTASFATDLNSDLRNYGLNSKYYRHPSRRVFVNRSLYMEKIKFFGFDMDYTLAVYKSPEFEILGFQLIKERLISIGYPKQIQNFIYDPTFPIRGVWFDSVYGNLLKVDMFGNILICCHGFRFLKKSEIEFFYPNCFLALDESRVYVINTLFHLPEMYMLACVVDFFSTSKDFIVSDDGIRNGDLFMSYKSIFQDIRSSVDWIHIRGNIKQKVVESLDTYVHRDDRLPQFLNGVRSNGVKCFLLTNSNYSYTNSIMSYLLEFENTRSWKSYFDYILVDACKPLFFSEGTILRQIDETTGDLKIGHHIGPLTGCTVYSGGSCEVFTNLINARGRDVLYFGDHIYGDILKSKKTVGWRTFLIVPELNQELAVWTQKRDLFDKIQLLDVELANAYKDLDLSNKEKPDITDIKRNMRSVIHEMDMSYGLLGSVFRSGSRQTFFAAQVNRYADVYAATALNLLYYPFCYMFRAATQFMPHELTVTRAHNFQLDSTCLSRQPFDDSSAISGAPDRVDVSSLTLHDDCLSRSLSQSKPEVPQKLTHHEEHSDEDEEDVALSGWSRD